jgi:Na+/melibiose symporter-like transporter
MDGSAAAGGRGPGRDWPPALLGEPVNAPTGRQGGRVPAAGRRVISTGAGITLITVGAILRFAVAAGSPHGLNVHVVGVILILAGVLVLLLSLLAGRRREPRRLADQNLRAYYAGNSRLARRRRAAAADVAAIQEDDRFFAPDTTEDDL